MGKKIISILIVFMAFCAYPHVCLAGRCAIFFFEYEHDDSDEKSSEEEDAIGASELYLKSSYEKMVYLVNTDATRDNLMAALQDAYTRYTTVDLYIHAHGGMQFFRGHFDDIIYVQDILSFGSFDNSENLRLVYIGSCYGWDLTDEFLEAGALASIGSTTKAVNFPFYPSFINNFGVLNMTVGNAVLLGTLAPEDNFQINGDKSFRMDSHN